MAGKKKSKTSKTTGKKTSKKKPARKSPSNRATSNEVLQTDFVARFTAKFLDSETADAWNPAAISDSQRFDDIAFVLNLLGSHRTGPVPPASTGSTFRDRFASFVNSRGWPLDTNNSPVPNRFAEVGLATVRMTEICDIVHRMLEAVNAIGGGGPGDELPPHHV